MGRVGRVLSFVRSLRGTAKLSDVKVNRGGGDNRTAEHFSAPGDDSVPLPGDYAALLPQSGTGRDSVVGYLDPDNGQTATAGERRSYARDPSSGEVVSTVHQHSDGTVTITSNGNVNINGVIIKPNGDMVVPDSLVLNGKELDGHTHDQDADSAGNIQQTTGGNL